MLCAFMPCALEINSNNAFQRACGILLFNHKKHIFSVTMPMTTKLGRQGDDLLRGTFTHKVIWPFDHVVLWDCVTNKNHYISAATFSPYGHETWGAIEGLLPINLLDPLITWSCEITWKIKSISTTTMPTTKKLDRLNLE